MMRMKSRLMVVAAIVILAHCVCADATVLNFDDLSDGAHLAPLNYAGFNWNPDYIYAESQSNFTGRGGLATFPSASIAVYNGYGVSVATISNTTNFYFNGAYFTNWSHTDLTGATKIELKGYDINGPVGSVQYDLTDSFQWYIAGFPNINKLEVKVVAPNGSAWWLMDNFTYNEPIDTHAVPEPTAMLLLGLGLIGLAGVRKRFNN